MGTVRGELATETKKKGRTSGELGATDAKGGGSVAFYDSRDHYFVHRRREAKNKGEKERYTHLIGGGNGNPLQCSCLENPRDGRAWWAAFYGVAQSWTRLK